MHGQGIGVVITSPVKGAKRANGARIISRVRR
jgi:hypothetical protein